jgi:hypothetical protein
VGRKASLDGGFPDQSVSSAVVGIAHSSDHALAFYATAFGAPHVKGERTLKPRFKSEPSHSDREDAKRALDEVLRRYGISGLDQQAHQHVAKSLKAPTEGAAQTRPTLVPDKPASNNFPSSPSDLQSNLPLRGAPIRHATGSSSGNRIFHYLIRIAECTSTLLCEVTADSHVAARQHVNQIPNLLECREISSEEFFSLARNFR